MKRKRTKKGLCVPWIKPLPLHSKLQMKHTNDISQAIGRFKHNLGRVFDDNLHTKQWQNMVDYAIIGLILLSTLEVLAGQYHCPPNSKGSTGDRNL